MDGRADVMDGAGVRVDLAAIGTAQNVILVEGGSDKAAVEVLARRRGQALADHGIQVVAMGGATNIGRFLALLGPRGLNARLAGLCDAGEEAHVRAALERSEVGSATSRSELEALGFYVCTVDLEDELIRAAGVAAVEQTIEAAGELRSFRIFQRQPAQRGRCTAGQLRRFMGTRSGRKGQYASLLATALDLDLVPRPLDRVLADQFQPVEASRGTRANDVSCAPRSRG